MLVQYDGTLTPRVITHKHLREGTVLRIPVMKEPCLLHMI